MAATKEQLVAKMVGSLGSLNQIPAKDLGSTTTVSFAENYNRLRAAVLDSFPELDALLPPEIELAEGFAGQTISTATYLDSRTYISEMLELAKAAK